MHVPSPKPQAQVAEKNRSPKPGMHIYIETIKVASTLMMSVAIIPLLFGVALSGTVGVEIYRAPRTNTSRLSRGDASIAEHFWKRALHGNTDYIPEALGNGFYAYYANFTLGSNDQPVNPMIDTGSSDLWLYSDSNPYCARSPNEVGDSAGQFNCSGFEFDPNASTTYRNLSMPFEISYGDTSVANGWLAKDTIKMSGATLPNSTFALAEFSNSTSSVFGIGYASNEATDIFNHNGTISDEYPNIPMMLKRDGYTDSIAYSLYLNDVDAQKGEILFGGVDHAKYEGTLGLMPVQNIYSDQIVKVTSEFNVKLSGLSVRTGNTACPLADFVIPVLLDSGTSYAILPSEIVDSMGEAMGYQWRLMDDQNYWQGPCSSQFGFDSFELDFLGQKLEVPPHSLLDYLTDGDGNSAYDNDGQQICMLAIHKGDTWDDYIVGDVFMRNWYIVYDLENDQIAMAQSSLNQASAEIEPIESTIPRATSVSSYSFSEYQYDVTTHSMASSCTSKPAKSSATF